MGLFRTNPNNRQFHSSRRRGEGLALSYIGSQWMIDKLYVEPRELEFLEYKEYAAGEYEELLRSFEDTPATMEAARSLGVHREWESYQLFAELGAPQDVFQYVGDDGRMATFSDGEIERIRDWSGDGAYPVSGIEGHHMHTVREHPDNLELAADPDNIMLATDQGHLRHLHGGNTMNPTQPDYFDRQLSLQDMFDRTLEHQHDVIVPGAFGTGLAAVGSSVALYTSVSLLLQIIGLRNDPRPWVQKKELLYRSMVSTAVTSSVLATAGFGATLTFEAMFAGFTDELLSTSLDEMLAMNGSFAAVAITSGYLKYRSDLRNGRNREEALAEFKNAWTVAIFEFVAFQAIGVGLELLGDMAADSLLGFLDPTGVLAALRLGYGMFKAGKRLYDGHQNKQAVNECRRLRMDDLRRKALDEWNWGTS